MPLKLIHAVRSGAGSCPQEAVAERGHDGGFGAQK